MRRILKKVDANEPGDWRPSTLADPAVVAIW
jgi:hypothetical protein